MAAGLIDRIRAGLAYESSRAGPPEGFPALPRIPGGRYTDPAFERLEGEHLWRKSWLYACHSDQLPEAGSYLQWKRTGSPIVIVRVADGSIRAFYNSCRHRGGPLVAEDSGTLNNGFVCGFHGWSYDLDGRLRGVRDKADFVDLDPACFGLRQVRCEQLGNWVFVNQDADAPPLTTALAPVAEQLGTWGVLETRHVDTRVFRVHCNFKLMVENFLEVYHLGSVHRETVNRFLDHRGTHMMLWAGGHSLMLTPHRRPDWKDPGTRGLPEFPQIPEMALTTNVSYNIYPNLVTPVSPSGLPFLVLWPTGVDSVEIESHWFAPRSEGPLDPVWQQRLDNFGRILLEDVSVVEHQQTAAGIPGFDGTRVGYQERRIYHWHEELDRRIGSERIPPDLLVEPRLGAFLD
jgi:phenylpropionate dioxygenase-like ring-hydroxylating dioxygenase large terminal subunit